MANLDFYALQEDVRTLVTYLFEETDVRVFESYSEYDRELREFKSLAELERAYELGLDLSGSAHAVLLQLWSPSVMHQPLIRRIELQMAQHQFRYCIEGVGLIQLYLGGRYQNQITHSHYGHWSEAGARQRATLPQDGCDWTKLKQISSRIQRHIRGKLAPAKIHGRVILPSAFAALQAECRICFTGKMHAADSPEIQIRT